jgi:hypothetical protein
MFSLSRESLLSVILPSSFPSEDVSSLSIRSFHSALVPIASALFDRLWLRLV